MHPKTLSHNPTPQKSISPRYSDSRESLDIGERGDIYGLDEYGLGYEGYEKFKGTYTWEWGWLIYLMGILPKDRMCLITGTLPFEIGPSGKHERGITIDRPYGFSYEDVAGELVVDEWVAAELGRCIGDYRFSVSLLNIVMENYNHANALVFDNVSKTVTRFEPHGDAENIYKESALDDLLYEYFFSRGWEYFSSSVCEVDGPQSIQVSTEESYLDKMESIIGDRRKVEAEGFCSVWSLMYIHLQMLNPDLPEEEIVEYLLSRNGHALNDMVRQYAAYIVNHVREDWPEDRMIKAISVGDFITFKYKDIKYDAVVVSVEKMAKQIQVVLSDKIENLESHFITIPVKAARLNDDGRYDEIRNKIKSFAHINLIKRLGWM